MKDEFKKRNTTVKYVAKLLGLSSKTDESFAPDIQVDVSASAPVGSNSVNLEKVENEMALDISKLSEVGGFIGACIVDSDTGLMLASDGGGKLDLEAAGAANTEVVKAKLQAIDALGLDDSIEDILITLGRQYHLIRPLENNPTVFIYVALDKKGANLGMARLQVKNVEKTLAI